MSKCRHIWDVSSPIDTIEVCRKCGARQFCEPQHQNFYVDDRTFESRPILLPNRVFREADPNSELCPICGSSVKKRFWCFGKIIGCYNGQCANFHLRRK